jgi:hypothetical protein
MSDSQALARDAGRRFEEAVGYAVEDAQLRLLRYHLLRLTVVGLGHDELPSIVDLARRAFDDADVADQATAIRERPGASELASALAGIAERSRSGGPFGRRGDVLVAAVIGAYAAMMDAGSGNSADATAAAVIGAVGAGTAATVGPFIQEQIAAVGVAAYLRSDERA